MAMCRAQCLRPFVSLREFGAVACRRSVVRRPLLCSRATFSASAAAAASAAPAAPAPKYASLPAEQQRQVDAYLDILLDWNTRMNLTAVTDRGEAYERHVNDSLALLPAVDRCLAAQAANPQHKQQRQPQRLQRRALPSVPLRAPPSGQEWEHGGRSSGGRRLPRATAAEAAAAALADDAAAAAAVAAEAPPRLGPRLIDVGSGAGLPGIILAIARPEWNITLLDSLQKRCKFTEEAAAAAGLTNVRVHWGRAEEAGQDPELRQRHDVAIARAVAELRLLAELCLPLVAPGGHWVAAKGTDPAAEVAAAGFALGQLGGKLLGVEEVDSESPEGRRTAVVVLKERSTPSRYPRKPGVPGKKPL